MLVCSLSARVRTLFGTHRYNHSRYSIAHCTFTLRALVSYTHQLLVCSQPYCYASPKPTDRPKKIENKSIPIPSQRQVQNGNPPPAPAFLATLPKSAFEALLLAKSHF